MQNLIINGIKYQPENNTPKITISGSPKGQFIEYIVTDNGIGMSNDTLLKIFDPLYREHKHEYGDGTGMGLSICKKLLMRITVKFGLAANSAQAPAFILPCRHTICLLPDTMALLHFNLFVCSSLWNCNMNCILMQNLQHEPSAFYIITPHRNAVTRTKTNSC